MLVFWLQNEHNIACPKNDLTTVFVAQSTDPPIKNGVIGLHGMYQTKEGPNGDSYYLDLPFDGKRTVLLNESKVEKIDLTHFSQEEISACCLPYHMLGEPVSEHDKGWADNKERPFLAKFCHFLAKFSNHFGFLY